MRTPWLVKARQKRGKRRRPKTQKVWLAALQKTSSPKTRKVAYMETEQRPVPRRLQPRRPTTSWSMNFKSSIHMVVSSFPFLAMLINELL